MIDITDAVVERLREETSAARVVDQVAAYAEGLHDDGVLTVSVDIDADAGFTPMASLTVDVDAWAEGPSTRGSDALAQEAISALEGQLFQTDNQTAVVLYFSNRAHVAAEDDGLAHTTVSFAGRAYR